MATNLSEKVKALFLAAKPGTVEIRLTDLSDADMDALAEQHGATVNRDVHFNTANASCPVVFPHAHVRSSDGSTLSLSGRYRQATVEEIDAAVAKIKAKVANCCPPEPARNGDLS